MNTTTMTLTGTISLPIPDSKEDVEHPITLTITKTGMNGELYVTYPILAAGHNGEVKEVIETYVMDAISEGRVRGRTSLGMPGFGIEWRGSVVNTILPALTISTTGDPGEGHDTCDWREIDFWMRRATKQEGGGRIVYFDGINLDEESTAVLRDYYQNAEI